MPQRSIRQAIEAMPRIRRQQAPSTTVDTFVQQRQPRQQTTNSQRIVGALTDLAGAGADAYQTYNREKIELDKVTQQQRALQGLDPTDDATDAGIRAYQVIQMRDQVMDANASLAEEVRKNPEMTDEEYQMASREAYAGLFTQYKPDAQLSTALSNKVQESQTQLHQIRSSVQREHREWQAQETFKTSLEAYREASSSPEELAAMMQEGGQLSNEADALGVSEEARRTMAVKMAQADAANGDPRLFQALQGQEWASRDPRVQKAQEMYQQFSAQENAAEIGRRWGEIQMGWERRTASWGQTQAAIEDLNDRFPGSVTANQVASLRKRAAARQASDSANSELFQIIQNSQNSGDPISVGDDPRFTSSMRDDFLDQSLENIRTTARQMEASGEWDTAQAQRFIMEEQVKLGRRHSLVVPDIKDTLANLTAKNPTDWDVDGIPSSAQAGLSAISMMNNADIRRLGNNETERTMFRMYKRFLSQDTPDRDAWVRAYTSVTNRQEMTADERQQLEEDVESEMNDYFNEGGLFSGMDEVPEEQRGRLMSEAMDEAYAMVRSGNATYLDDIIPEAANRVQSKNTRLDNGNILNASPTQIRRLSTYEDEEGNQHNLSPQNFTGAFEYFYEQNRESLVRESAYGEDLEFKNLDFQINNNGLVEVRDTQGDVLSSRPLNLRNLAREYNQHVTISREEAARARKARQARQRREILDRDFSF